MSSDGIAPVRALYRKADELSKRGHMLRAAEVFGRAAEAARALAPGPDDLVVAEMQRRQAIALLAYVTSVDLSTPDASVVAHCAVCNALLSMVVTAVERRRVAGTLLEGKCSAAEEACFEVEWLELKFPTADAASLAKLVGFNAFLRTAFCVLGSLENAFFFAEQCSAAQYEAFAQCVAHATDLMQLPHSHDTLPLAAEAEFAVKLSAAVAEDALGVPFLQTRRLDPRLVQLLTAAWQRLQRSGVLQARGLLDESQRLEHSTHRDKYAAVVRAAMAAPGLRSCALASCSASEAHPQHFKSCAACRTVVYCCREHQVEGWPSRKKACKAACKAKAAAADGDGAGPGAAS